MIVFDLQCSNDHTFEVWFPSSEDFEKQRRAKKIECPICGDTQVDKALMAPSVTGAKKTGEKAVRLSSKGQKKVGQYIAALREIREHVEKNSDYVGDKFPDEARKIHYGETEERSIHGEATAEEAEELSEEGIEVQRIPWVPTHDA
ncbi:MAG: hypothetical protein CMM53_10780 [Rhodospirillaceae bacterium]|nr:hypothetical protein [Rhodospirillaceae bacterium]|tara:strand:+ start:205 stop:642 length:438 start_codon:yes stop_codon:yes gene_type:complete